MLSVYVRVRLHTRTQRTLPYPHTHMHTPCQIFQKAAAADGKTAATLQKLQLFRSFYLMVRSLVRLLLDN